MPLENRLLRRGLLWIMLSSCWRTSLRIRIYFWLASVMKLKIWRRSLDKLVIGRRLISLFNKLERQNEKFSN